MALTDDFKGTLACWATGVSVVAVNDGGLLYGLTVSSFASVSLDPPLILVCLSIANQMPAMIERAGRFSVSFLGSDQEAASVYFASAGREPTRDFVGYEGELSVLRQPVVKGAMAHLVCELHDRLDAGTHAVMIGQVVHAARNPDARPLLYFRRGYRQVDPASL
ncbi:MAG: flavin reductase family protein [Deltaproteobacteria bacterium]|nr:flavin reductase family protein [Deltaproteobacteria bacterium]MBW2254348.1 flavin reductase family protein [Deltaproteobacteria bacterium]